MKWLLLIVFLVSTDVYSQTFYILDQNGNVVGHGHRTVARRQEMVAMADHAALEGKKLMVAGEWSAAATELRKAIDLLPDAPVTESKRLNYERKYLQQPVEKPHWQSPQIWFMIPYV